VNFVVGYFGTSWKRPALEAERLWEVAYQAGLASGDLFHTGCAAAGTVASMFMRGVPFDEVVAKADAYERELAPARLREPLGVIAAVRQATRNLAGRTAGPDSFGAKGFDEEDFVASLPSWGSRHFAHIYFIVKMQTLLLWGRHERALAAAEASKRYLADSTGLMQQAEHTFYHALILCESARRSPARKAARLRAAARLQRKLQRWAAGCPENFLARERLVAAELARTRGSAATAGIEYEEALQAASAHGQVHLEGMGRMLVAAHLADQSRWQDAAHQRSAAAVCLRTWGATALAESLESAAQVPAAAAAAVAAS
jgi:hypothetical protein